MDDLIAAAVSWMVQLLTLTASSDLMIIHS